MAPMRVLIVHDDAAFFDRAKQGIVAAFPDAQVNGAISAPRALGMAKQQLPDAIIADGDLEGMDGYAFTAELKSDAAIESIPVLIVADQPTEASALKARQVGAAGHLPSSADMTTLVQKIGSLLQATPSGPVASAPQQPVDPLVGNAARRHRHERGARGPPRCRPCRPRALARSLTRRSRSLDRPSRAPRPRRRDSARHRAPDSALHQRRLLRRRRPPRHRKRIPRPRRSASVRHRSRTSRTSSTCFAT